MVVMEERGIPAGLRQAPREMRRKRGRAAPGEVETLMFAAPNTSTIYRGGGGWFLALQVHWGVGKGGGKKSHHFPSPPIVIPPF